MPRRYQHHATVSPKPHHLPDRTRFVEHEHPVLAPADQTRHQSHLRTARQTPTDSELQAVEPAAEPAPAPALEHAAGVPVLAHHIGQTTGRIQIPEVEQAGVVEFAEVVEVVEFAERGSAAIAREVGVLALREIGEGIDSGTLPFALAMFVGESRTSARG